MDRRRFIKRAVQGSIVLSFPIVSKANILLFSQPIRFGVSADIHVDIIHDVEKRIHTYLEDMKKQQVDFLVDMGDFCHPLPKNKAIVDFWNSYGIETYRMLGNHDMDHGTKEEFMSFVGMDQRYYSFDKDNIHFIVLDPNNLFTGEEYIPYANGNYFKHGDQRTYIDSVQLEWLKKDLKKTDKHCIVFAHQSFENPTACRNREEVRQIFEEANKEARFNKVIAAFSGHDHTDYVKQINGIYYIQLNSMSYQWVGYNHRCETRFTKEINEKHGSLSYTIPYDRAIYAKVTIKNNKLIIDGISGHFVAPGPEEVGITDGTIDGVPLSASITDRKLKY
jgi:predicted phosphodiesterase